MVRYESGELAITRAEADAIHGVKLPAIGGAAGNGTRAATPVEEPAPRAATPVEEPEPEPEPKPQPKPKPKSRKVNSAVLDRLAAKPKAAAAVLAVAEKKKKPKSKPLSSGFLNRMNKPMAGAR